MNAAKPYLLDALQQVANGSDIKQDELDAAIPNPLDLDKVERLAWQQLTHWVDDADIRQIDKPYAKFKRQEMRSQITVLSDSGNGAEPHDERKSSLDSRNRRASACGIPEK